LTPLHATLELARRVDRAEIDFCALAGTVGSPTGVVSLEAGGGRALFGRPGSPLNKVLGLGHGPVSDRDLDRIESFYADRGAPVQVELCPLAASNVAPRLNARGYVVQAFENELARTRPAHGERLDRPPVHVTLAKPEEDTLWIQVTAEGFAAFEAPVGGGAPGEVLGLDIMMEMMSQFAHPKIRRYLAWIAGEPAGGGAAWSHQGVLGIFGTATLPAFRRQGVQRAVTLQAMDEANDADLVIATTAPGSTSQRTFERLGFNVIYTRAIFVKEAPV
jgi:ribosomal protein S18 acetylase RimI-like enzyme